MRVRLLLRLLAAIGRETLAGLDARDAVAVLGLVIMALGLSMVSVPAALVVSGGLLFLLATWPVFSAGR